MQPIKFSIAVTPSNDNDLVHPVDAGTVITRYITCTTAGTLAYKNENGNDSTADLAVGVLYPIACKRVLATGTSATGIKAHF